VDLTTDRPDSVGGASEIDIGTAARSTTDDVLDRLGVGPGGLTAQQVTDRAARFGRNVVASRRARVLPVLARQVRSPLLALLVAAAVASYFVGEHADAIIIGVIVLLSVGLGFGNEFRAERAAEALHSRIQQRAVAVRDGEPRLVDVRELVPGDIVDLRLGTVVPADLRLLTATRLECDESVLTGEPVPVEKTVEPVAGRVTLSELSCCALMGTVVHAGSGRGVVIGTGSHSEFGRIAADLSTHHLDTEFQIGLRRFSMLLVYVAGTLTSGIFIVNVAMHRPLIDALLFSLAIAVGITPQLLPAVVSTSLAAGSRRMSRAGVLVKRLVCIEDLGDIDTLFTDKTGTLTDGRVQFMRAVPVAGHRGADVVRFGLLACETGGAGAAAVGANALDSALLTSPVGVAERSTLAGVVTVGTLPFDHERRLTSTVVQHAPGIRTLITKGAPEAVLERCGGVPPAMVQSLAAECAAGNRVIAVATRPIGIVMPTLADERDLELVGLLVFHDPPKADAAAALTRLRDLGIAVKIVTGDNAVVAEHVCRTLGLTPARVLTGADVDEMTDTQLAVEIAETTVFARVSPEQKARVIRLRCSQGSGVAFLGDGVNDVLALHAADVGISVDTATDVAKDAADVILLGKDLGVLAGGVVEGRRIFANTIKYVLMGTSSNFGNMFSAAGASLFLPFLPMLPSQILLNNLLYDASQLAIPTDEVDEDQLRRPSHWDIGLIRRFMVTFGPISSLFDFATFGVMLWMLHAGPAEFRTGWFVESLATQTLVIFAIRTRRVPFFRSRPSLALALAAIAVVMVGALLPFSPLGPVLGFQGLPAGFYAALAAMVILYLVLIEFAKLAFHTMGSAQPQMTPPRPLQHLRRRTAAFRAPRRDASQHSDGGRKALAVLGDPRQASSQEPFGKGERP
jgi:Mg2+-importing ATPase